MLVTDMLASVLDYGGEDEEEEEEEEAPIEEEEKKKAGAAAAAGEEKKEMPRLKAILAKHGLVSVPGAEDGKMKKKVMAVSRMLRMYKLLRSAAE